MPTCKKYVTDDVIVIGREKTFARSARQTDKHCAPRETIPGLLLNQFIAFQSKFLQTILTSLQLYHSHLFFIEEFYIGFTQIPYICWRDLGGASQFCVSYEAVEGCACVTGIT